MLKSAICYNWESRVEKARIMMTEKNMDALYVTAGPNQFYFSGFSAYPGGYPIWLSTLLIPLDSDPVFILTEMHRDIFQYAKTWITDVRTYLDGEDPTPIFREILEERGLLDAHFGVEDNMWFGDFTFIKSAAPNVKISSAQDIFDRLRMVKDDLEIKNLRRSNDLTVEGYRKASEVIREGVPEYEAAQEISKAMLAAGADAATLHGSFKELSQERFQKGDIVDVDMGASYNGYETDTARNVFIGEPTEEEKKIYQTCVECFDATFDMVKPGIQFQEVHLFAEKFMKRHGYEQKWKIGHGVGLMTGHEAPQVQEGNTTVIEPGMVFVIDPGVFATGKKQDSPIHIESLVLVTENGAENLTRFPHDMIVV